MAALCRNAQISVTRRLKSWHPTCMSVHQVRICSRKPWENGPWLGQSVQRVLLGTDVPFTNVMCKRQFQILSNVGSNLHGEDMMASQITSGSTIDSIFVTLNSIDALKPAYIISAFGALDKLMFAQLLDQPWAIYSDHTMLFIQSLMNSEAKEIYDPVLQCPEFGRLCYEAQKYRTTFSNLELVAITRYMVRMHIDLRSDVFRNMLYECQARCDQFDVDTLVLFADIANFIKRPGFILSGQVINVLQKQWDDLEISQRNFLSIIRLMYSVGYFFTKETLFHYQKKILEMLRNFHQTVSPDILLELLEALSRFSGGTDWQITEIAMLEIKNRLDEVSVWSLPRIAYQLSLKTNMNHSELVGMLAKRASSILTDSKNNLRPADVVGLVRMNQSISYPPSSMKALEFLLEGQMKNLDVLLLRYVTVSSQWPITTNTGLVQAFCDQIQLKVKDLLMSVSCLLSITHSLSKIPYRPPDFDRVYSQHLMQHMLNHQLGTQPKHVATIGRYLVQCFMKSDFRSVGLFTGKLIYSIPFLSIIDIANVSLGIKSFDNSCITTRTNYDQIITNFAREILLRRDQIENISVLNLVVKSIFTKLSGPFQDAIVNDLEDLYLRLTPSLALESVKPTCYLLKQLRMRITTLCDRLVEIITRPNRGTEASLSDIAQVLDLLIRVNYCASNLEAVQEVAKSKIAEVEIFSAADVFDVLLIAHSLASFQMFPEDIIKRVFSIDFLTCLDAWLTSKTRTSRIQVIRFQKLLTNLNRSVMLQCPELSESVAWFCNHITTSSYKIVNRESNAIARWKTSVHSNLADALGGYEYVREGPLLSPYNHSYDFECYLDKDGNPLPVQTNEEHVRYRVAVLLMTPTYYCTNTRTLSGFLENKIAQLEILGFKVVTLPYSHLDSMMLNDTDSRQKYFYNKIVE